MVISIKIILHYFKKNIFKSFIFIKRYIRRITMSQLNTINEALEELKNGKIILVVDDEDRENEGDFICAAEFATLKISISWLHTARA